MSYGSGGSASGGGGNVIDDTSPQLGGNLDANANNIDFDDNTGIRDDSGNEQLIFQKTASAVNHLEVTNAATGNSPSISAAGADTNIDVNIIPKGTGVVNFGTGAVGIISLEEGTPSGAAANKSVLAADSTASRLQLSNNNGAFSNIVTAASSDNLTNKKNQLPANHGSDNSWFGTSITGLNNSGGVTQWDVVYLNSSSQWVLADANGSGTYPARGLAVDTVATANATEVLVHGTVRNDAWSWTIGAPIYLSATAGGLTQTAPSTSGDKVQVVGFALSADIAFFDFNSTYVTVT